MPNPEFVDVDLAIAIHDDVIEAFGGMPGLRDQGLLESGLSQPKATFFGDFLHPTIADQAAAYLYHITKNHAFVDGNKRTALGVMEAFLGMNAYELNLSDQELYNLVIAVSTGEMEKSELADLLKCHLMLTSSMVGQEEDPPFDTPC